MNEEIEALIEMYLRKKQEEKAGTYKELLDIQENACMDATGHYDMYNIGLYNGLAIGLGILMNEEPKLFEMKGVNKDVSE